MLPPPDGLRSYPHRQMTLEQASAYIDTDELVEVTPKSIRLRKKHLVPHLRKRAEKVDAYSRRAADLTGFRPAVS